MKSQYISIFLIIILITFIYIFKEAPTHYFYTSEVDRYLAEDFKIKILLFDKELVNDTYSKLCLDYNRYCYYNGTHIVVISGNKNITIEVKD